MTVRPSTMAILHALLLHKQHERPWSNSNWVAQGSATKKSALYITVGHVGITQGGSFLLTLLRQTLVTMLHNCFLLFCSVSANLCRCLQSALGLYPLEVCLPHLTRSLDAVKAAKSRTALLEIFSANCGQAVTTAAALPALRYPPGAYH